MKLILFDIDGTLLTTDGAGRAALRAAGADVFAIEEDLQGVAISGNTDVAIVHEILNKHGIPASEINVNRYLGAYPEYASVATPVMASSDSGVVNTRSAPNFSRRPSVEPWIPL